MTTVTTTAFWVVGGAMVLLAVCGCCLLLRPTRPLFRFKILTRFSKGGLLPPLIDLTTMERQTSILAQGLALDSTFSPFDLDLIDFRWEEVYVLRPSHKH